MHLMQVVFPEPITHFSIGLGIEIFKRWKMHTVS